MKIIDVSRHNGFINWDLVEDVKFVIIRLGYRGYGKTGKLTTDSQFKSNVEGCIRNNIPYGVYYFPQETNFQECQKAAEFIVNAVEPYRENMNPIIWLDSEYANGGKGRGDDLIPAIRTEFLNTIGDWVSMLSEGLLTWGVYCSDAWYKDMLSPKTMKTRYEWIARYNTKPPRFSSDWLLWQYSSRGTIKGIQGNVDLSILHSDFRDGIEP